MLMYTQAHSHINLTTKENPKWPYSFQAKKQQQKTKTKTNNNQKAHTLL